MSCPDWNFVYGIAVGSCCATRPPAPTAAASTTINTEIATLAERDLFTGLFPRRDSLLVVRLFDVEEAHPRKAHVGDGALSVPHPVCRVGVVLVRRRVVVPRRDVDDRACRKQRCDIFGVRVGD